MELAHLLEDLSRPEAYPYRVARVEVAQTHISVVFLAGPFVYKIKKTVQFGFLDFSTVEKRHFFCEQEVVLNRRLAPDVYLGVVPVTRAADGRLQLEGPGEVVEWAVKMRRLPEEATLGCRLAHGTAGASELRTLAARLADFHRQAAGGARIQSYGRFEVVAGNARENFAQSEDLVGITVSRTVFERLRQLTEAQLQTWAPLIEARAARGVIRDTHGDLRLDHVYLFPDQSPPGDVIILDCIEFNERFRFADPVADIAFLVMDLQFHGYRDLARLFAEAYAAAADDTEGSQLLHLYTAYRAVVRGKVEGFKLKEREVSASEQKIALGHAHAHWLLALGELAAPAERPCLVLVGGLPGSGKSTLARGLAERAGFTVLRSDVIRKELAGLVPEAAAPADWKEDLYAADWTERTYRTCLRRSEELLFAGQRVLVDASFRREQDRRSFLEAAQHWGVPGLFLICHVPPDIARQRLHARTGDASDADWNVHAQLAQEWEPGGPTTAATTYNLMTDASPDAVLRQALARLRRAGLSACCDGW
jgi:aminoglycoside phosphotransferase family enzyme/predicted kinase